MKKIAALFIAAAFLMTLGVASAEEDNGSPWQQKESTPLLSKDKSARKEKTAKKKKVKHQKKQKARKKKEA